jgi:hypothetical protein
MQFWFKIYKEPLMLCNPNIEELFVETLYLVYFTKEKGNWV